jgi:carbon monoxide dehydrogenase subunit G
MPRIAEEIAVGRPPGEVFALVCDPESDPRWRSDVRSVERVSGEPSAPGTVYRQRVGALGGEATAVVEVAELVPDRAITFAIREPVTARGGYEVEPAGAGAVVRFWLELPSSGGLRRVADKAIAAAIARGARGDLARLKGLLEA